MRLLKFGNYRTPFIGITFKLVTPVILGILQYITEILCFSHLTVNVLPWLELLPRCMTQPLDIRQMP